jgi:hypothetical protein
VTALAPIIGERRGQGTNKLTGGFETGMGGQTLGGNGFCPLVPEFRPLVIRSPTLISLDAELQDKLK